MRTLWRVPVPVLLLVLAPALAHAEWASGRTRIGDGFDFVMTASGPDRVVVAWAHALDSPHNEVLARAWSADGIPAPGWPADGARVSNLAGRSGEIALAEDGAGGVFVGWLNGSGNAWTVRLQHMTAAGTVAAGWDPDGMLLSSPLAGPPALAADRNGGVYVGWGERYAGGRLQHIDGTGARPPGWPIQGLTFPNISFSALLVDLEWHVFASTIDFDVAGNGGYFMAVHRLNEDGTFDPAWPAAGATLRSWTVGGPTWLSPDGHGGVFSMWKDVICADCLSDPKQHASRILGAGVPDVGWGSGRDGYSVAPDDNDGMLVGLVSEGHPGVLRLDVAGAPRPGWAPGGNAATTSYEDAQVMVTRDGQGGAYAAWVGTSGPVSSHLDESGRLALGWPQSGSRFGQGGGGSALQLLTLAKGIAIAQWMDGGTFGHPWAGYITALQPGEPGPVVEPGPPSLQVVGNPARGRIVAMVNLPKGGTAKLDLVDASGRRVESQSVSLPAFGRSYVLFNQAATLAAGVYWIRLTHGGTVASQKVAVLE
jgi:hypothetical protein